MEKVRMESLGIYLPPREVSTPELMRRMQMVPDFDLERITGIRTRRVRESDEDSCTMAVDAARDCLARSRYAAADLDAVICTSISRLMGGSRGLFEPALSLFIKNELGARQALNFDISNACAGLTNGLYLLQGLIEDGVVSNGLVVSGECSTDLAETALQEIDGPFSDQFASLTVGDSGAAVLLERSPDPQEGIDFIEFTTLSEHALEALGLPSDRAGRLAMYSNSRKLSSWELVQFIPRFLGDTLDKHGLSLDDYDYIIPHQVATGVVKKHLTAVEEHLKPRAMPKPLVRVEHYGNTATTTHFVVLHQCLRERLVEPGSRVLMMITASGVVLGLTSLTVGTLEV